MRNFILGATLASAAVFLNGCKVNVTDDDEDNPCAGVADDIIVFLYPDLADNTTELKYCVKCMIRNIEDQNILTGLESSLAQDGVSFDDISEIFTNPNTTVQSCVADVDEIEVVAEQNTDLIAVMDAAKTCGSAATTDFSQLCEDMVTEIDIDDWYNEAGDLEYPDNSDLCLVESAVLFDTLLEKDASIEADATVVLIKIMTSGWVTDDFTEFTDVDNAKELTLAQFNTINGFVTPSPECDDDYVATDDSGSTIASMNTTSAVTDDATTSGDACDTTGADACFTDLSTTLSDLETQALNTGYGQLDLMQPLVDNGSVNTEQTGFTNDCPTNALAETNSMITMKGLSAFYDEPDSCAAW